MKCKHCGQEIERRTNFDALKECRNERDFDRLTDKLCKTKTCPWIKQCPHKLDPDHAESACLFLPLRDWIFGEAE